MHDPATELCVEMCVCATSERYLTQLHTNIHTYTNTPALIPFSRKATQHEAALVFSAHCRSALKALALLIVHLCEPHSALNPPKIALLYIKYIQDY